MLRNQTFTHIKYKNPLPVFFLQGGIIKVITYSYDVAVPVLHTVTLVVSNYNLYSTAQDVSGSSLKRTNL